MTALGRTQNWKGRLVVLKSLAANSFAKQLHNARVHPNDDVDDVCEAQHPGTLQEFPDSLSFCMNRNCKLSYRDLLEVELVIDVCLRLYLLKVENHLRNYLIRIY